MKELSKIYEPRKTEEEIYKLWKESGFFNPDNIKSGKKYCNILPPPNANGELHLGHASGYAIMDIFGRYERMKGKKTLLLPGKDHAGIPTQVVYEQKLKNERGITRQELGREKFYREVYDFCVKMSDYMRAQEKKIGISADWSREKFTLDPKISETALETFVKMHKDGLIYKGKRIISWCPRCGSALSDLEVKYREREGHLYYIKYPLENSAEFITVATTRPETMLGDSAIAVNPRDKRHQNLIGKKAILPLLNRIIPVIADKRVDANFGTGAVKVTPAHDPLDWEIGKDNNLEEIRVIDEKSNITLLGGKYEGLGAREAREKIIEDLQKENLLEKIETIKHSVSECERCKTVIEPLISDQWFINVDHPKYSLKKEALKAIREGEVKIYPKNFEKILIYWFENLRDWCVSRQIWWGHRFPIWYKYSKSEIGNQKPEIYVGVKPPKGKGWVRDENTFDTWFSSGQWAYTALGYPAGKDFKDFYPSDMMVMGRDLLFFWAARMIMMGLYRTGKAPFKNLYFTGLVRDKFGHKMSKSRGNGIDPLKMIEKFGSDALRLSLVIDTTPGLDFRVYEEKIESFRNFTNKLWNISRYALGNADEKLFSEKPEINIKDLNRESQWILHELNETIEKVNENMENFNVSMAGDILKHFTWNTFADWYLEFSKIEKNETVLIHVLKNILKLWHPFMPFMTEHIWQEMENKNLIMMEKWPEAAKYTREEKNSLIQSSRVIEKIKQAITGARNLKANCKIPIAKKVDISIIAENESVAGILRDFSRHIKKLAGIEKIAILSSGTPKPEGSAANVVIGAGIICLSLEGIADIKKEREKIQKELGNLQKYIASAEKQMANKSFMEKAPEEIKKSRKESLQKARAKFKEIKKHLDNLTSNETN